MLKLLISVVLGVLLPTVTFSQVIESNPKVTSKFSSPFEIQTYINGNPNADLATVFRSLGVKRQTYPWLTRPEEFPGPCQRRCETEILTLRSHLRPNDTVLRITYDNDDHWYLFFQRKRNVNNQSLWLYYGFVEKEFQRYRSPTYRIIENAGRSWFVLGDLFWGGGTGAVSYGEEWFNFDGRPPKVVLRYPAEGHDARGPYLPGYVLRVFSGKIEGVGSGSGSFFVRIHFSVTYMADDDQHMEFSLFFKNQVGYYRWNAMTANFQLDKSRSTISATELDKVYNVETLSDVEFVDYNYRELTEVATQGSDDQKSWLKKFLLSIEDTPKKRALQGALGVNKLR